MSDDTIYTYVWTPAEGRALMRRIEAYLKKERERKRRWRAKQKAKKKARDGGFGVVTEDGRRISMWDAESYGREE